MKDQSDYRYKPVIFLLLTLSLFSIHSGFAEELAETSIPTQTIQTIQVVGATLLTNDQITDVTRPFRGQELNMGSITKLVEAITGAYQKEGFFLARAYLPEQEIQEGKVVVSVLEGRVGEISISGNEYYTTTFIQNHFGQIDEPSRSRLDLIKRSVLILDDYPDLSAEVLFKPGGLHGTTDMQIRIKDFQPIHLSLDYNNFGSKFVSRDRFGIGVEMGNLLSDGHLLSLRSVLGSPVKSMISVKGGYTAPVGYRGQKLHFSYVRGDFDVGRAFEQLDIQMKSESIGVSMSYPFIKTRFSGLSGEVGLERNNFRQSALERVTSQDKIRVLRGGLDYDRAADVTRDFLSFQLSQGIGTFMGGMGRISPSASRPGADNQFTKGTVDWVRVRAVPEPFWMYHPFSLIFAGGIQWSSDNLVVGEQFSLGGPDSVRGYPTGEFLGDHGYRMSSELRVSPFPNTEKIQGAFFVDHGGGFIKKRLGADMEEHYLTGMGVGVRFNFPGSVHLREPAPEIPGYIIDYQFQIRADIGYPLYPRPSSSGKSPVYAIQAVGRF